ncbi:hypothetical protein STEG23_031391 [Scotinomys teguina]
MRKDKEQISHKSLQFREGSTDLNSGALQLWSLLVEGPTDLFTCKYWKGELSGNDPYKPFSPLFCSRYEERKCEELSHFTVTIHPEQGKDSHLTGQDSRSGLRKQLLWSTCSPNPTTTLSSAEHDRARSQNHIVMPYYFNVAYDSHGLFECALVDV